MPDVREFSSWLRRWSGYEFAGQPGEIFDAPDVRAWLGWASLDWAWPEDSREVRTLDLWLGDTASAGARVLDPRIESGRLEVVRGTRAPYPRPRGPRPDAVVPAARPGAPSSGARAPSGGPAAREPLPRRRQPGGRGVSARVRRRRAAAVLAVICVVLAAWLVARLNTVAGPRQRGHPPAPGGV